MMSSMQLFKITTDFEGFVELCCIIFTFLLQHSLIHFPLLISKTENRQCCSFIFIYAELCNLICFLDKSISAWSLVSLSMYLFLQITEN